MATKKDPTFQVLDKRRTQTDDQQLPQLPSGAGYRRHIVLLGYLGPDHARDFLGRNDVSTEVLEQAMQHWGR